MVLFGVESDNKDNSFLQGLKVLVIKTTAENVVGHAWDAAMPMHISHREIYRREKSSASGRNKYCHQRIKKSDDPPEQ